MKASKHFTVEREARIDYIVKNLGGLGSEVVLEATIVNLHGVPRRYQITNNGVLIIRPLNDFNFIITAWISNINQAVMVARKANYDRMPDELYRRILANKKLCMNQP